MFRTIADNIKKSRAAVVAQNLFETLPIPFIIPGGPARFANAIVEDAWLLNPNLFSGRGNAPPHHISVAAAALAHAMEANASSRVISATCMGALGRLLVDVEARRVGYSMNDVDMMLIDGAIVVYNDQLDATSSASTDVLHQTVEVPQPVAISKQPLPPEPIDPVLQHRKLALEARLAQFPKR
jgi:hypothetical protein